MLTIPEKIIFAVAVCVSMYLAWGNFSRMFAIIRRGQGRLDFGQARHRLGAGLAALAGQGRITRHRRVTSLVHLAVAWGFIYYLLVNAVDLLHAFLPGFHFLDSTPLGGPYRLLADLFSVTVLAGVAYFLVRRFIAKSPALTIREDVRLHPRALSGIRRDSLLVGLFILGHVGFRFLGESFLVAQTGGDPWQPFASAVAGLWAALPPSTQVMGWHGSWWLAMGLILAFVPYFPASKHAHLFMGPLNFMVRPQRRSPGALETINFDDETIEQFGATHLTDLPPTQLLDAFACIMCNRCQEACPAYLTGKELSPSALEINKRYHIKERFTALAAGEPDEQPLLEFASARAQSGPASVAGPASRSVRWATPPCWTLWKCGGSRC
jgi:ferredoxin